MYSTMVLYCTCGWERGYSNRTQELYWFLAKHHGAFLSRMSCGFLIKCHQGSWPNVDALLGRVLSWVFYAECPSDFLA